MTLLEATVLALQNKLNENKQVGIIYHYTSIFYIADILESSCLSTYNGGPKTTQCFTRRNDMLGKDWSVGGTSVKIIVDGDLLSEKYKVKPINALFSEERYEAEERVYTGMIPDFIKYIVGIEIDTKSSLKEIKVAVNNDWRYMTNRYKNYYDEKTNRFYYKKLYNDTIAECKKYYNNIKEV